MTILGFKQDMLNTSRGRNVLGRNVQLRVKCVGCTNYLTATIVFCSLSSLALLK